MQQRRTSFLWLDVCVTSICAWLWPVCPLRYLLDGSYPSFLILTEDAWLGPSPLPVYKTIILDSQFDN